MEEKKINIVVADDHKLFRKGIKALLHDFKFIENIYEVNNGQELLDFFDNTFILPDVVLLDIKMPVMDGVEAQEKLKKKYPNQKVIILTMEDDEQFILYMVNKGINGYLMKNADPEELEKALLQVSKTDFYFPKEMYRILLNGVKRGSSRQKVTPEFSEKEICILDLICKEHTAVEIADILKLSSRTIEGYRGKLLVKTGAKNIAGLVVYALKNHLVTI